MKKDLDMHIQEISISDKEINKIVDIGIIKKEGFFKYLFRMIKTLGLKNIFYDKAEVIVILIALFLFNSLIFNRNIQDIDSIYVYIFILTPISYLVISFFSYFNIISSLKSVDPSLININSNLSNVCCKILCIHFSI